MAAKIINDIGNFKDIDDRKMFLNENDNAVSKLKDLQEALDNFVEELTEIENNL